MKRGFVLALAAGAALSALPPTAAAYRTGPPTAHTGGFGEPTCAACHWAEGDEAGRGLQIGAPAAYEPGAEYDIVVELTDPALTAAGFQLSARFAEGGATGAQAGTLAPTDSAVRVVTSGAGIMYASHSEEGVTPSAEGSARWIVRWTAPADGGTVAFSAAANAANDDDSEYGDRTHVSEVRSHRR